MPKVTASSAPEIRAALKALSDTPKLIAQIARGCDDRQLHRKPAPDAWSARDIMAHLRVCADVWGRSIDRMLTEDHPTIRYVSPRGWIKKTNYLELSFEVLLEEFTEERGALLKSLRALAPVGWSRGATFTGTTLGRSGTVMGYARRIADHEVHHLDQFHRTLGS